jgi:hypothetical protein
MKKVLALLLLVTIIVGSLIAYMHYNKPHRNPANEAAIKVSAAELFKLYENDETKANESFLDKTLEITGTVGEITFNQEKKPIVMLQTENTFFGVRCTMLDNVISAEPGQTITLRGICTGYLSDVVIIQATIINDSQNQ